MISSRDQRRIYLLPGRPDQTRNPGLQDLSTRVKQDQQSRPMCQQIPIGAAHILFLGQHRMRLATSKTNPQVAPRWHCKWLCFGPTLRGALARGFKIKMTLESAEPKGKRLRWQMLKPMLGLAGGVLFKANCQGGPINHPTA